MELSLELALEVLIHCCIL